MQSSVLSGMTVQCDNITPIEPAILFECVVDGKKMAAKLTHQEDNGVQFIYRISFSDGYSASFVASLEAGKWHDENLASAYAKAIHDDLNAICGFMPAKPPFCIRVKGGHEAFNVWIVPHSFKSRHYAIFYKGDYRFDLRKAKQWEAKSIRENSQVNQEIAAMVCKNIDERFMQPVLF